MEEQPNIIILPLEVGLSQIHNVGYSPPSNTDGEGAGAGASPTPAKSDAFIQQVSVYNSFASLQLAELLSLRPSLNTPSNSRHKNSSPSKNTVASACI